MEKLRTVLQNIITGFNYIFCSIFILLTINILFFNKGFEEYIFVYQLLAAAFSVATIYLLTKKGRISDKIIQKNNINSKLGFLSKHDFPVYIILTILFFIQIIIVNSTSAKVGWDVSVLVDSAFVGINDFSQSYFSHYTNNLFVYGIFKMINTLNNRMPWGGTNDIWNLLGIFNLFFVDVSLLLTFKISAKLFSKKTGYIAMLLLICLFGLSPWIIVPYSDIYAMPFTLIIVYLGLKIYEADTRIKLVVWSVLVAAASFIGYLIKPQVLIAVIAIFLFAIVKFAVKDNLNRMILLSLLIVGGLFLIFNTIWNSYIYKQTTILVDKERSVPFTHFIMMGLNIGEIEKDGETYYMYGAYSESDVFLTLGQPTTSEMKEVNKEVIKQRLQEYGVLGYSKFFIDKARWISSDGQFYWGREGNFMDTSQKDNIFSRLYYYDGVNYQYYKYFSQGIWASILFFIGFSIFKINKIKDTIDIHSILLKVIITGILLFTLFFEGRSRYLILYIPCFCILAAHGCAVLQKQINDAR